MKIGNLQATWLFKTEFAIDLLFLTSRESPSPAIIFSELKCSVGIKQYFVRYT